MGPLARSACSLVSAVLLACLGASSAIAQQQSATSIDKLLSDGWEVAGYVSAWENRSLILFKHKEHRYLVQCSALIDVMRSPRVVTYCYEIGGRVRAGAIKWGAAVEGCAAQSCTP